MMATGGKKHGSRFFQYFTYALELGTGLTNWDCLLLNMVTVPLKVAVIAGKWPKNTGAETTLSG